MVSVKNEETGFESLQDMMRIDSHPLLAIYNRDLATLDITLWFWLLSWGAKVQQVNPKRSVVAAGRQEKHAPM